MAQVAKSAPPAQWSSQFGFIVAAIGSAVGLGNIWRFPGVAYENGGGAFLIPYLVALFTAGIPILFFDYAIGHRFRGTAPLSFRRAAGKPGEVLGWFQVMICVVIALYYTAVIAWTASYFVFSFNTAWDKAESASAFFINDYLHMAEEQFTLDFVPGVTVPMVIFWLLVIVVLSFGVVKGVQRTNMIAMPLLIASFLALVIGALTLPGAMDGIATFFTPDFAALSNPQVWLAAYGQIFFSLSIAFGIMVAYSSYQKKKANLSGAGLVVAFSNSSFELLAGIGVFAALGFFAHESGVTVGELEGLTGVGLAFITFPAIVSEMPIPPLFGALFFGSLLLAGFSSLISILEVVLGGFIDKFKMTRVQASWLLGLPLAVVSIVLFSTTSGLVALDTVDYFSNQMGIVLAAVIALVLVLWIYRRGRELSEHISLLSTFKVGAVWRVLVTIVAPASVGVMFFSTFVKTITEGYSGYPEWYLLVFGWGTIILMIVCSVVLTSLKWTENPAQFTAWPPVADAKPVVGKTAANNSDSECGGK